MSKRIRADELLVQQGLAPSRTKAQALIMAGEVRAGDRLIVKPAERLDESLQLQVERPPKFVSRGGLKLDHALQTFDVTVNEAVCADIGASTGGFTDCLLQHGARRVYAIDVGYGQLHYKLRQDDRVVVMERTNARYLDTLPEQIDLVVVDVSFISLRLILPVVKRLLAPDGEAIVLIKPQFEAGKHAVNRRGVVVDERERERAVLAVARYANENALWIANLTRSPQPGPAGNEEFLAHLVQHEPVGGFDELIARVFKRRSE